MPDANPKLIAVLREVSPAIQNCELTHLARQPIDLELAVRQHRDYAGALQALGCETVVLPASPALPDSVFVEDAALVLDELAVITRPGAPSRRQETPAIRRALQPYRRLAEITAPGTLEGGDILILGRRIYVGQSTRSNLQGLAQLLAILAPFGYQVQGVPVQGCLHLKSAVTQVGPNQVLLNPQWVDPQIFDGLDVQFVDPGEPYAANAVWLEVGLVYPACFPRTQARLAAKGITALLVDVSELQKAEGAVTCCSLIFKALPSV
jgi:dimethylargininase